ncbi:MAG: hypothetical protein WBG86_15875, partial [Polyangiales bacterium]
GVGGRAGMGGTSGMGGMGGGAGGAGGLVGDRCEDPVDLEVRQRTAPNLRYQAAVCATTDCSGETGQRDAFIACVDSCVRANATPANQLSGNCGTCYGELAWCASVECNTLCAANETNICEDAACIGAGGPPCADYGDCLTALNACAGPNTLDCPD